jgi:endoglucanase
MHILDEELFQAGMAIAACPTAPCREGHVRARVLERLHNLPGITTRLDEFGNLHATYRHGAAGREAVRLVAHMDHPAFLVQRGSGRRELHFGGGVAEAHFLGKHVVFFNEESKEPLGRATITGTDFREDDKLVRISRDVPADATFATWDLPPPRCTKQLFVAPACDDLAQVATMLALLRRLSASKARAHVHALFTRAEEIGFAGALAALKAHEPLVNMPTLSLEISKARGFAQIDGGPVVRVGDRSSIFDSRVTQWLEAAFRDLQAVRPDITYQRLLMGGGTCEASVFQRTGMPTGALCVALNNYHNMGPGTSICSESISLRDWQGLYDFLYFLATDAKPVAAVDAMVAKRFAKLEAMALNVLRNGPSRMSCA